MGRSSVALPKAVPEKPGVMARLLAADNFSPLGRHLYHYSHFALASAVPLAVVAEDGSGLQRAADIAMAIAIPWHSHVSLNSVVSDYVPKAARPVLRVGLLGLTGAAALGMMQWALEGPGLTSTVKKLWRASPPANASK